MGLWTVCTDKENAMTRRLSWAAMVLAACPAVCLGAEGPAPRERAVAWGQAVTGVQAGLRPVKVGTEPSEEIEIDVYLRNTGQNAVTLHQAGSRVIGWQVTFTDATATRGTTWLARWTKVPTAALPVTAPVRLARGEEKTVRLRFDEEWQFVDQTPRRRGLAVEPLRALPHGVYEVTAAYTQGAPADKEWWGTLIAGPAVIVIGKRAVEPPPDGRPAPDTPPATRPAAGDAEINALIAQLGDDDLKKREAATERLIAIGGAARPALEAKLRRDLHPEVHTRVEKILSRLSATGPDVAVARRWVDLLLAGKVDETMAVSGTPFSWDGTEVLDTPEALKEQIQETVKDKGARDIKAEHAEALTGEPAGEALAGHRLPVKTGLVVVFVKARGDKVCVLVRPGDKPKVVGFRD